MENNSFKALVIKEKADGSYAREIDTRTMADLPDGEVLIRVHYSSLNYKDALSASGNRGVTRRYPMYQASMRPALLSKAPAKNSSPATR